MTKRRVRDINFQADHRNEVFGEQLHSSVAKLNDSNSVTEVIDLRKELLQLCISANCIQILPKHSMYQVYAARNVHSI